jgi:hypothetical protein
LQHRNQARCCNRFAVDAAWGRFPFPRVRCATPGCDL